MRVIVIGCGIGGAATSLGLSRVGISHVVLEQAGELAEVGAGLQMSPNATRVLQNLGLGEIWRGFASNWRRITLLSRATARY